MSTERLLFDQTHQSSFDLKSFQILLAQLFVDYDEANQNVIQLFNLFDKDQDGLLSGREFESIQSWIERLNKVKFALIVIDMQNDFIDGTLALKNCSAKQHGADCIPVINRLIETIAFDKLVYTLDWHPENHISFYQNLTKYEIANEDDRVSVKIFDKVKLKINDKIIEQILWPVHCVMNSEGAELHKDLIIDKKKSSKIYKGTSQTCDSYSAFFDNSREQKTELDNLLKQDQIDVLFISGLAIDYCVAATTKDALDLGYCTILIEDACKGVDKNSIVQNKLELKKRGCLFINSNDVQSIVNGKIKLFELGLNLAKCLLT